MAIYYIIGIYVKQNTPAAYMVIYTKFQFDRISTVGGVIGKRNVNAGRTPFFKPKFCSAYTT